MISLTPLKFFAFPTFQAIGVVPFIVQLFQFPLRSFNKVPLKVSISQYQIMPFVDIIQAFKAIQVPDIVVSLSNLIV
jgi:hypothetical protein